MIMPGATIGRNCVIEACVVVAYDVPDNTVVAGAPARSICTVQEYRDKHRDDFLMAKHMGFEEMRAYFEARLSK